MNKKIKFGIIGPGRIATKFCDSLQTIAQDAEVYAIASRDEKRAHEFASHYNARKVYHSYNALVSDQEVDIIYIATPHPFHFEQVKLCLTNKKAVLCEKPMTISHQQTSALVELARKNKTFLMEAMWSRFIPANVKMKEWIDQGILGEIQFMHADFGFIAPNNIEHRTFNKALGGGAQLDVGVYPMFLALWLLGAPTKIKAVAKLASTGIDENTSALLEFENGAIASIYSSFIADSVKEAVITGTKGTITIHTAWHKAMSFSIKLNGTEEVKKYEFPYDSWGLQFQAMEAIQCLREGKTESSKMTLDLSLIMAKVADEILQQVGVSYDLR